MKTFLAEKKTDTQEPEGPKEEEEKTTEVEIGAEGSEEVKNGDQVDEKMEMGNEEKVAGKEEVDESMGTTAVDEAEKMDEDDGERSLEKTG